MSFYSWRALLWAYILCGRNILKNRDLAGQLDEAQRQVVANQKEIDRRRQMIDDLNNNSDAVARIAREKFGWCRPGERVYKFTDEELLESSNED